MHTLIVCGTPWCDLDNVFAKLEAAGLTPPERAAHGSIATMADWHQRLFAHRPQATAPVQPGKAWEQAAGEIFLANWEHPLWGWADHRSTWLLDFWLQFDPQTCFVLVHTPAVDALVAAALDTRQPDFDAAQTLDTWCAYQAHMLQFYLRHRDRCAWYPHLPANQAQITGAPPDDPAHPPQIADDTSTPALASAALTLQWPVPIALTLAIQPAQPPENATLSLLRTLAQQTVQKHEPATTLQSEIWASIPGLGDAPPTATLPSHQDQTTQVFNLVREVAVMQTQSMRQQLHEHSQTHQQLAQQISALRQASEQYASQAVAAQAQRDTARQAQALAAEENELLLQQLHQVQEELENHFLRHQEALQTCQARDTEAQAALQAQLQQAQAAHAELLKKQEQLTQAHKALQADFAQTTRAQTEANEENELLLLQLHQVQEELENYFLRHQEAQQTCQQLQQRLTRWAQRYPDHCEWDSLAVLPHTDPQQQDLLITQLQHGSRSLAQLHVQLRHSKKQHHLILQRSADQPAPLLHWPQATAASGSTAPATSLTLDLRAQPHTPAATALAQLAPSDLHLLIAVCRAIAAQLPSQGPDAAAWAAHWQASANALTALPPAWRYDHLSLRHEQVNPDYEHLWLHFDNAQYAQRRWPSFEFRLSASNVRKQGFSHLPKLEFPQAEAHLPKPFEHWFEESEDDKGPKFELRFDIKTPALDIQNWNALNTEDKAQALELVRQLPHFLRQLEQAGTPIHRPWADWHRMADGIRHALTQCLGIAFDTPPAQPTRPAPALATE